MSTVDEIKRTLKDKKILIIEDDIDLIDKIEKTLINYGMEEKNIVKGHHIEFGITTLQKDLNYFDILMIDVMIPKTYTDFQEVQALRKQVKTITDNIEIAILNEKEENHINNLNDQKDIYQEKISNFIRKEGGIEMINKLYGEDNNTGPKIMFLTAIADKVLKEKGRIISNKKPHKWITKPISTLELMGALKNLFN